MIKVVCLGSLISGFGIVNICRGVSQNDPPKSEEEWGNNTILQKLFSKQKRGRGGKHDMSHNQNPGRFWVNVFFPGFVFDSPGSLKNPGAIRQNWRSWEVPRLRKGGRRLEDLSQASFEDLKTSGENKIETTPACVPGPAGPQESGESVVR